MGAHVRWYPPCSMAGMSKRLAVLVGSIAIATSVVACGDEDAAVNPAKPTQGDGPNGTSTKPIAGHNEQGVPVDENGIPVAPRLHGKYELYNKFDLTSTGVLPDVANTTLKALSDFRESPSSTIVQLVDAANLPVVDQVLSVLPGAVKNLVFGWIDETVFKQLYAAVPVTKQIAGMLDDLASIVTQFELVTTLDMPEGDAIGDARSPHSISGVAYNWSEKRHVINAPELLVNLTKQTPKTNAVLLDTLSDDLETGRLKIGDHTFSIPVGSFTVYAADKLVQEKFGVANLREAVGKVVNCDAIAKTVSEKCYDPWGPGKVCVGHEKEIKGLCTTGLDLVVGVLIGQIKALDIPLLKLEEGTAQMWDAPAAGQPLDAIVSRIDKGFWTASINAGGPTPKPVIATFTGKRLDDVAAPPPAAPK
jgi:hypothetical protein